MNVIQTKSESIASPVPSSLPKHCDVQPQYVYESTIHSQNLLNTLNEQRKFGLLCDITVIVEGVELLAHKAVLAACSTYFSGIITDPANVSHNIVLELSSISKIGMENLLEFAYTSKLTVSKDNIDHVLSAARELEMKNLEYSCLDFLRQKLVMESSEVGGQNSCAEGKRVCRNSTISRKLVPSSKSGIKSQSSDSGSESKAKLSAQHCPQAVPSGSCLVMSQLSLNPKPAFTSQSQPKLVQQQPKTCSSKPSQQPLPALKPFSGICVLPKPSQPSFFPGIFQGPRIEKGEGNISVIPVEASGSNPQFTTTCLQPQFSLPCNSKYICYNSDTDEPFSADEDSEKAFKCGTLGGGELCKSRKYPDVELPLSVEEITKLPRSELQELLNKHPQLSVQQMTAMNEIRRRGKNRIAAQRCRKRKMDCIRSLQCELESLHKEYNDLMCERRCVRDNMLGLISKFNQRYKEVFSGILTPCGTALKEKCTGLQTEGEASKDQAVFSMAKFFENEFQQASRMAEQLNKLPCSDLPPIMTCPLMSTEIILCDDEDEKSTSFCNKPRSPGVCSTTSMSSDVQESSCDVTPMQDITCSNVLPTPCQTIFKAESPEEMSVPRCESQEITCDNSSRNSIPSSSNSVFISNTTPTK